jgi:hypothetical protein
MSNDYYGWQTRSIENDFLRLEFLTDAGPRIVRLFLRDCAENWLAEVPDKKVTTTLGDYFFYGGHRLWYAPEKMPQTYQPDNAPIHIEPLTDGVSLHQPPEPLTGIRKHIEIHLHAGHAALTLSHHIENAGAQSIELAPWAITQLKLGGMAILPQTIGAVDTHGFLPNRNVVLWSYTRLNDPRLELRDQVIRVHARAQLPPCKVGCLNQRGWLAYWHDNSVFVKRFAPQPDVSHPDLNCNAEVYCNDKFIELETLAPMVRLVPGTRVTHNETWEFYSNITLTDLDEWVNRG